MAQEKRYSSRNEWAEQIFKLNGASGKYECQVQEEGKDKKCGHAFGAKTSKQNWVDHLVTVHKKPLPKNLVKDAEVKAKAKQMLMTPFVMAKDPHAVQVERLVVAYCMNCRVSFATMDVGCLEGSSLFG